MYTKILNLKFEKRSRDDNKKQGNKQSALPVRNSYVTIMHQPVIVSSNTCSQIHVHIKHSLVHLQIFIIIIIIRLYSTQIVTSYTNNAV